MFITDYSRFNHKLAKKPHPLPRIGETMQQLEGFQYETELYINMGYYTIRLSPASEYMTAIATEFGKFRYNLLPMGMCTLGDIFQSKVYNLIGDIEGVKTYIDGILVLRQDCIRKHTEQLRMIFGRLCASGLKSNAPK